VRHEARLLKPRLEVDCLCKRWAIALVIITVCTGLAASACTPGSRTSPTPRVSPAHAQSGSSGRITLKWAFKTKPHFGYQAIAYDPAVPEVLAAETIFPPPFSGQSYQASVTALNPANGNVAWTTAIGAEQPAAILTHGGLIVVPTAPAIISGTTTPMWILDAKSGKLLDRIDLTANTSVSGFAAGHIIIEDYNHISAIDPTSQATAWTYTVPPSCTISNTATDDSVVGALVTCEKKAASLIAIDPADGTRKWRRVLGSTGSSSIGSLTAAHAGFLEYASTGAFTFYSPSGKPIITRLISSKTIVSEAPIAFTVQGKAIVAAYQNPTQHMVVIVADKRTGKLDKQIVLPVYSYLSTAAFSANIAYLEVSLPQPILAQAILQVNLSDGSTSLSAAPFIGFPGLAVADSTLYTTAPVPYPLSTLTTKDLEAYTLVSPSGQSISSRVRPQLQGSPQRWPDSCSLIPRNMLSDALGRSYFSARKDLITTRTTGLPNASKCEYYSNSAAAKTVYASVIWDGQSEGEAKELFDNAYSTSGYSVVRGPWDEGFQSGGGSILGRNDVVFRLGPLIVEVYDRGAREPVRAVAAAVVRHIRSQQRIAS